MKIVWDERKREANLRTHKLDFARAVYFQWDDAIIRPGHSGRLKAIGHLESALIALVFKQLGVEGISIVSMRPASRSERSLHGKR